MSKGKVVVAKEVKAMDVEPLNSKIQGLLDIGIPLKVAIFHDTVRSFEGNGTPEFAYYDPSEKCQASRKANLWYTPHGVVMEKNGKYKLIPLANCKDTFVL